MSKIEYDPINWEEGVEVTPAKVLEDNTIQPAEFSGRTPISADNLNKMEKGITDIIDNTVTYEVIEEIEDPE